MSNIESIKIVFRLFAIVFICFLAIICLINIALEVKKNNSSLGKSNIITKLFFQQKFLSFFLHPWINISLKSFLLVIVLHYIIKSTLELYGQLLYSQIPLNDASFSDFAWYYVASKMIHESVSPYDPQNFINHVYDLIDTRPDDTFVYPPNILPLIFPLGYFSIAWAARIFFIINLISVGFLLWGAVILLDAKTKDFKYKLTCFIACFLLYGVTLSLHLGNISTIIAALAIWTVILANQNKNALAGFLLGISTIKPTFAILFVPYFLLKKRFSLLGWYTITSFVLISIGLWLNKDSLPNFYKLYKLSYELFLKASYTAPETSVSRIDIAVIGARLFPHSPTLAHIIYVLIVALSTIFIGLYLYKQQQITGWSSNIYLSEVTLITCLNIMINYAQQHNAVILALAIVFLLNYLINNILDQELSWREFWSWCAGIFFLIIHTNLAYFSIGYIFEGRDMPYIVRVTIGTLPSYAILGLIISVLILTFRNPQSR